MRNKLLIVALALFVSVCFLSCGGDSAKRVKEVKVQKADGDSGYILTWDAVGKNVDGYLVYAKHKDKITPEDVGYATNGFIWKTDGSRTDNTNADNWTAWVDPYDVLVSGDYYFGVRSGVVSGIVDYSKIRWTKDTYNLKQ